MSTSLLQQIERVLQIPAVAKATARAWDAAPRSLRTVLLRAVPSARFRVGVLGVLFDPQGRVLLLEHRFRGEDQPWGLPGGWLDAAEEPRVGLVRELREELGLRVPIEQPELLAARCFYPGSSRIEMFFRLRAEVGPIEPHLEFHGSGWFAPSELPDRMFEPHKEMVRMAASLPWSESVS